MGKQIAKNTVKIVAALWMLLFAAGFTSQAAGSQVIPMIQQPDGVYLSSATQSEAMTFYNQLTLSKPSVVTVTGLESGIFSQWGFTVNVCDGNMRVIAGTSQSVNANQERAATYALKAGTYYFVVDNVKNFRLAAVIEPKSDNGGNSKKKATKLKMNKEKWGIMPAGEKGTKTDWYKFTVTKSRVLYLNIKALNSGAFEFYLYGPSYSRYKSGYRIASLHNQKGNFHSVGLLNQKKLKIKTGTYYIKVVRSSYSQQSSGAYSLKWKLK